MPLNEEKGEKTMKKFTKEILQDSETHEVFSVDKILSKDKMAAKVIVLFNDNTVKSKIVKNNRACAKGYKTLRRHCLQIRP